MKVLFLGAFCIESEEQILLEKSKNGVQNSVIIFQRHLIKGIEQNIKQKVDIINFLPVGCYPNNYKDILLKDRIYNDDGSNIVEIGAINLPFIKHITQNIKALRAVKKWICQHSDEEKLIIMYDLLYPYLSSLHQIKGCYANLTTCTVIADLPNQFGYQKNENWLRALIKQRLGKKQLQYIHSIDYFGLITQQVGSALQLDPAKSVVIEGFYSSNRLFKPIIDSEKKIILYSGALFKIYGIDVLISAFKMIKDPLYELWLCGTGDYVSSIIAEAKIDHRICYYGYLAQNQVAELQANATVLVNPRQNNGEYTKYSFPSKIMEYLSTARPVVAYRLDGIPNEYYDYIFSPTDNSPMSLSKTLENICRMPIEERRRRGTLAFDFVSTYKNSEVQCKKLINLIQNK